MAANCGIWMSAPRGTDVALSLVSLALLEQDPSKCVPRGEEKVAASLVTLIVEVSRNSATIKLLERRTHGFFNSIERRTLLGEKVSCIIHEAGIGCGVK